MKHVISYAVITLAVVLLHAAPAAAQVSAGLNELGGWAYLETGKYSGEENVTLLDLRFFYGKFITDHIEIGPGLNLYKYGEDDATGAVNGFVSYYFGDTTKRLIPYVEGAVGQFFNGGDDKPLFVAIGPGVKWFFGDGGGALNMGALYRRQFYDADLRDGASGANEFGLQVGVSVFFGR